MDLSSRLNGFNSGLASNMGLAHSTDADAYSPLSVHMAFSMLLNGCDGVQAKGLGHALGVPDGSVAALNQSYQSYIASAPDALKIANGIWRIGSGKLTAAFTRLVETDYRARVSAGLSAPQAQADADAFVKANTKGRIDKLPMKIRPNTTLVLVNALAFDGVWKYKFPARSTRKLPFNTPDGEKMVDTMHLSALNLPYAQVGSNQYLRLPYADGRFSMVIALPDKGASLNFDFAPGVAALADKRVTLDLPKFRMRSQFDLIPPMTKLGAGALFTTPSLFAKIFQGGDKSIVSQAVHVVDVAVDEDGTKAAAVTAIGMMRAGVMRDPHPPLAFVVDRPFTFAIWDDAMKTPVFVGVVRSPKS